MDRMGKAALNIRKIILGRRALQCVLAFVLCFAMLAGSLPAVNARAEGGKKIIVDFGGVSALNEKTVNLYQVGECVDGDFKLDAGFMDDYDLTYTYNSADVDKIVHFNKSDEDVVKLLEKWVATDVYKAKGYVSTSTTISGNKAVFDDLKIGTYLVVLWDSIPTLNVSSSLVSLLDDTMTVTAKPEEAVQIDVEKIWDDNNEDYRPRSVIMDLYVKGSGEQYLEDGKPVQVTLSAPDWKATKTNLPKNEYEWRERSINAYTSTRNTEARQGEDNVYVTKITNTPKTISLIIAKQWMDTGHEEKRPDSITVNVYKTWQEGTEEKKVSFGRVTLTKAENWAGKTLSNLPVYEKVGENYVRLTYVCEEDDPGDYYVTYDPSPVVIADEVDKSTTVTVENTYPETTSAQIVKIWDDNNNQDGVRPAKLLVKLFQDLTIDGKTTSKEYGQYELKGEDYPDSSTWEYKVTQLPTDDGDKAHVYSYRWVEVMDATTKTLYTTIPPVTVGVVTTITNKHEPEKTKFTIEKRWVDGEGNPLEDVDVQSIQVKLSVKPADYMNITLDNREATGTVVFAGRCERDIFKNVKVDKVGDWKWVISNLPVFDEGTEIKYNLEEIGDDVTLGSYDKGPKYYFDNMKDVRGEKVEGTKEIHYTITNHKLERTNVFIEKQWVDSDNEYKTRPETITILLTQQNTGEVKTATVRPDANGEWKCEFPNLPKYTVNGDLIIYVVSEVVPPQYENSGEYPDIAVSPPLDPNDTYFTIVNRYPNGDLTIQKTVTINGEKVTDDASVIGTKYYFKVEGPKGAVNPMSTVVPITIMSDGVGSALLHELRQGVYHIEEVMPLPDNVTLTQGAGGYDIEVKAYSAVVPSPTPPVAAFVNNIEVTPSPSPTPSPEPTPTTSISGQKVWDDNGNKNGVRPSSIDVRLYDNNNNVVNAAPSWGSTDGDVWSYSFSNLPAMTEEGEPITYTVVETPVEYYVSTIAGTTITNSLIPKTPEEYTNIDGAKTWNDGGNAYGIRPAYISVTLLQDGVPIASATVTAATNWQYRFENLPVDDGYGHIYEYTVSEVTVPGYYTVTNGSNIINGLIPDEPPEEPDEPDPPRYRTPPEFGEKTEEELEELIDLFEYETPLFGRPLGTGDDIPVYPFIFAGIGLAAVLVLLVSRRRGKNEG